MAGDMHCYTSAVLVVLCLTLLGLGSVGASERGNVVHLQIFGESDSNGAVIGSGGSRGFVIDSSHPITTLNRGEAVSVSGKEVPQTSKLSEAISLPLENEEKILAPAASISTSAGSSSTSVNLLNESNDGIHTGNRRAPSDSPSSLRTLSATINAWDTDTSIHTLICEPLQSNNTVALNIFTLNTAAQHFNLPLCVAEYNLEMIRIEGRLILTNGLASLPPSLKVLTMKDHALIVSTPGSTVDGFDDSGVADWDEIFNILPLLAEFTLEDIDFPCKLPLVLPSRMRSLSLNSVGVSGTIPRTLLSNWTATDVTISISAHSNSLEGTIPPALFHNLTGLSLNGFEFNFKNNRLSGSLPAALFSPLEGASLSSFVVDLRGNNISGSIEDGFLPTDFLSTSGRFTMYLQSNSLTGTLPQHVLGAIASAQQVIFNVDSNGLSGPIPLLFESPSVRSTLVLSLSNNTFDGAIPPTLLSSSLMPSATSASFIARSNALTGPFPSSFLPAVMSNAASQVEIDVSNNMLSGPAPLICTPNAALRYDASNNLLSGVIPEGWTGCKVSFYNVGWNSNLGGTIPASLFGLSTLNSFNASHTAIQGYLPPSTSTLKNLDLSYTGIDFCSSNSSYFAPTTPPTASARCSLICTTSSTCSSYYGTCDTSECPNLPAEVPTEAPTPSCPASTRPSPDFFCMDGLWVAPATVTTTTLIVPSGAGTLIVQNITSSTIIFNGFGSSLNVSGCASNLTSIVVELSESEAKQLGKSPSKDLKRLLSLSGAAIGNDTCNDLSHVSVSSVVRNGGCSKVSASKAVVDGGSTLGAYFLVDSSGCNRWWIILVSVVCAVVVVGVIAIIVSCLVWKNHRETRAIKSLKG